MDIHGKMLVKNFKQAMVETYGLSLKVHQGFSRGQFASDDSTLAAARSEQAGEISGQFRLHGKLSVQEAEELIKAATGFAVQVLDKSGENAPNESTLDSCGFRAAVAEAPTDAALSGSGGSGISVTGQKKLSTIQSEFTGKFPHLGLLFFPLEEAKKAERGEQIRPHRSDQTVASVRTMAAKGDMSIHGNTTVGSLEGKFRDDYGLYVQVCYMREGKPVYTAESLNPVSLSELNRRAGEQGRGPFKYPAH